MPSDVFDRFNLGGLTCVVTGGASGLGREMCLGLASAGAAIIIADIDDNRGLEVRSEMEEIGAKGSFVSVDVSDRTSVAEMVEDVVDQWGRIDILVNSAGIGALVSTKKPHDVWDDLVAVNLTGTFNCCLAIGEHMLSKGGGRIINIASMSGSIVNKLPPMDLGDPLGAPLRMGIYCTTKAGVIHLTKSLATSWASYGVKVNSISPGYMRTPLTKKRMDIDEIKRNMVDNIPMKRVGVPQDLIGAVVYLASDASDYVTGHDLVIDGGYTCW